MQRHELAGRQPHIGWSTTAGSVTANRHLHDEGPLEAVLRAHVRLGTGRVVWAMAPHRGRLPWR
jgi:hypothetical protein